MPVRPSGKEVSAKLVQPEKAEPPILVMPSGKEVSAKLVQL